MKLKYYMMGLGVGIVLTTLIFLISGYQKKPTDEEIKKRALQLGMIMKEENKDSLRKVLDKIEPTGKPTAVPSKIVAKAPTIEATRKPTIAPTVEPDITFTIEPGMASQTVAELLSENGLIEDAKAFNAYIIQTKKTESLVVGTYSIKRGATYDEIIEVIAR